MHDKNLSTPYPQSSVIDFQQKKKKKKKSVFFLMQSLFLYIAPHQYGYRDRHIYQQFPIRKTRCYRPLHYLNHLVFLNHETRDHTTRQNLQPYTTVLRQLTPHLMSYILSITGRKRSRPCGSFSLNPTAST